ncbi:uncharacterized protein LOC111262185 [Varroa jacobsoni]|uniref:uncharacterized protein LOC111262185 n=1 Tax=Varroa jacobsoni TaxID=62625 RepID=UPI000BF33F7C|nr:uncharacterized protein LOC111262185 [Varroa jacobsoni]
MIKCMATDNLFRLTRQQRRRSVCFQLAFLNSTSRLFDFSGFRKLLTSLTTVCICTQLINYAVLFVRLFCHRVRTLNTRLGQLPSNRASTFRNTVVEHRCWIVNLSAAPPIDKYELNIVSKHLTADYLND